MYVVPTTAIRERIRALETIRSHEIQCGHDVRAGELLLQITALQHVLGSEVFLQLPGQ